MRLGFYTNYTPEIAQFAQETGFGSLELSAWPRSLDPSTSLDADMSSDEDIQQIRKDLDARDIEISALGYYGNYLGAAERDQAEESQRYFRKVLQLAERMEVPIVATHAGQTAGMSVEDCLPRFAELFTDFCADAEARGIRIAIENCPMVEHKTGVRGNLAYSPEIWEVMFDAVPSPALGLEFDPSHLPFLGIDVIAAIREFGDRIIHVHAKDVEIDERKRGRMGFYGQAFGNVDGLGNGWWRFRAPGWGVIDWKAVISALMEVGYDGNLDIEHEDEVFAGSALMSQINSEASIVSMLGKEPNALVLGYRHLAPLMPLDSQQLLPH
jgi:sugar phosphate isomerase/epimerase